MANLKSWSVGIEREIDIQKEKIYKRDYKFFKLDRLKNLADRTDEFSIECEICKENKTNIEEITTKIPEYLSGNPSLRSEYEKRNEKIVNHLKNTHNLYPANYFASVYSLAGFSAGIVAGAGISYLLNPEFLSKGLIFGFVIGLFVGRILGTKKDKQQKKDNLIL